MVGVIVQAITGLDGRSYARQQLDACRRNGLHVQGYLWAFPRASRESILSRLAMFDGSQIEALWLDVEQSGLSETDVDQALAVCDEYMGGGPKTGVYGARWFWAQQGWLGSTRWANRPLWNADYNHTPVVGARFVPFGGWTKPAMSQYEGTSSIGSVHQVDLDVASA